MVQAKYAQLWISCKLNDPIIAIIIYLNVTDSPILIPVLLEELSMHKQVGC